jgi:hypothetical protein
MALLIGRRRPGDNPDSTPRMNERIARASDFDEGHDLGPSRNIIKLMRPFSWRIAVNQFNLHNDSACPERPRALSGD